MEIWQMIISIIISILVGLVISLIIHIKELEQRVNKLEKINERRYEDAKK